MSFAILTTLMFYRPLYTCLFYLFNFRRPSFLSNSFWTPLSHVVWFD